MVIVGPLIAEEKGVKFKVRHMKLLSVRRPLDTGYVRHAPNGRVAF